MQTYETVYNASAAPWNAPQSGDNAPLDVANLISRVILMEPLILARQFNNVLKTLIDILDAYGLDNSHTYNTMDSMDDDDRHWDYLAAFHDCADIPSDYSDDDYHAQMTALRELMDAVKEQQPNSEAA